MEYFTKIKIKLIKFCRERKKKNENGNAKEKCYTLPVYCVRVIGICCKEKQA